MRLKDGSSNCADHARPSDGRLTGGDRGGIGSPPAVVADGRPGMLKFLNTREWASEGLDSPDPLVRTLAAHVDRFSRRCWVAVGMTTSNQATKAATVVCATLASIDFRLGYLMSTWDQACASGKGSGRSQVLAPLFGSRIEAVDEYIRRRITWTEELQCPTVDMVASALLKRWETVHRPMFAKVLAITARLRPSDKLKPCYQVGAPPAFGEVDDHVRTTERRMGGKKRPASSVAVRVPDIDPELAAEIG